MIRSSRKEEALTQQEARTSDEKAPTSSRLWSALKNPRIVRVSRSFGGKDRHSKVSTVRGLRDRRVRLSVPTAIQLYDLQDKLGLNQPSKVVDWLLNAAQHEIDKLPPLEIPPGSFVQIPQSMTVLDRRGSPKAPFHQNIGDYTEFLRDGKIHQVASSSEATSNIYSNTVAEDLAMFHKSAHWNPDVLIRMKEKETLKEPNMDKGSNNKGSDLENQGSAGLANNVMSYSSCYQLDPSTAYLSYLRSHSSPLEIYHGYYPISMLTSCMTATTSFDVAQYSQASLASENIPPNCPRSSSQSGNSNVTTILQPNSAFKRHHPQEQDGS